MLLHDYGSMIPNIMQETHGRFNKISSATLQSRLWNVVDASKFKNQGFLPQASSDVCSSPHRQLPPELSFRITPGRTANHTQNIATVLRTVMLASALDDGKNDPIRSGRTSTAA